MDLKISKQSLHRLLARILPAVPGKSSMPILACFLLEAKDARLLGCATDLYSSVRSSADCTVSSPGQVAVNAKTVADVVKNLPEGELSLKSDDRALVIKSGKIRFKVPTMQAEDFPPMPTIHEGGSAVVLKASTLASVLRAVAYASSSDDSRPHLNGISLEADPGKLIAVCTDGHRLAFTSAEPERGALVSAILVPFKAFAMLKAAASSKDKDATVTLAVDAGRLHISVADADLTVSLADAAFPPYGKVIPADGAKHVVTVRRDALIDAVKRIGLVAGEKSGGVRLSLDDGRLTIVSENVDVGEGSEELDVDYAGAAVKFGCNAKYLTEALASFEADEVLLATNGELDPIKITATGETTSAVCMPMRIT